jgi:hypothetical protein
MTHEDPGSNSPEDTPAPLASTRWAEEAEAEDDGLVPPFIPGASGVGSAAARPEADPPTQPASGVGGTTEFADAPGPADPFGTPAEAFPFQPPRHEAPVPEAAGSDDFPFDAFDLSGGEAEAAAAVDEPAQAMGSGDADDVADRLEALARRLRDEGAGAAESALASGDRLTALLAGVLAGYLAGRR